MPDRSIEACITICTSNLRCRLGRVRFIEKPCNSPTNAYRDFSSTQCIILVTVIDPKRNEKILDHTMAFYFQYNA